MIRLTFMTDSARVIGPSTRDGNAQRFAAVPQAVEDVMGGLYPAPNIAVGAQSVGGAAASELAGGTKFIITTDPAYRPPAQLANVQVCTHHMELVERFQDSPDELNVIGGHSVFRMFLHHAHRLDIAETLSLIPGDLVR